MESIEVKVRCQYEKFFPARAELLGFICTERGITLWEEETNGEES